MLGTKECSGEKNPANERDWSARKRKEESTNDHKTQQGDKTSGGKGTKTAAGRDGKI